MNFNRSPALRTKGITMTVQTETSQAPQQENKSNDKEHNFRMQQAKYERQLAQERASRLELEKEVQRLSQERSRQVEPDDDDSEPYVNDKKLNKTLARFGENTKKEIQSEIEKGVKIALQEDKKQSWLRNNPDFYDVLENNADKFAAKDPELADSILQMPDNFERQKLVYKNIKALGIDRPEQKQPSIQETIDKNKRSPHYHPSGVGTAPFASSGDFSQQGQKQAYEKMQQLKNQLRI